MIDFLHILNALVLGLFVGSLLTEAVILVPYWRKLNPDDFFRLHGTLGPSLYRYFAPLTIAATVVPVLTAMVCLWFGTPTRLYVVVVAFLVLVILGLYFSYFMRANARFETRSVSVDGLAAELSRWSAWHWVRTTIALASFALSLLSLVNN
jgi:Domain of unknown function (DUF1772)